MSQPDVNIVQSIYDAFDGGDIDSIVDLLDDDFVATVDDDLPWSGTYHGPAGFRDLIDRIEAVVRVSFESDEYITTDHVVAQIGTGVADVVVSGRHFTFREIHIWGLREGKVVSFYNYSDTAEHRRALGLDALD